MYVNWHNIFSNYKKIFIVGLALILKYTKNFMVWSLK